MKKFRFKLQGALNLRLRQEEMWKGEVRKKQDALRREEAVLEELRGKMEQVLADSAPRVGETFDVERRRWALKYVDVLRERQSRQMTRIRQAQGELEQAKEGLLAVRKERLMLEKLRDKQLEEHRREVLREEQKLLDEMANAGYCRNQAREG